MAGDEQAGNAMFDSCRFVFVVTKSLPASLVKQYQSSVESYGGEVLEPDSKGKLPIPQATHVISNSIDFPEYTEAEALMVPVVTTDWIKISIQRSRQAQVRPFSPDPRMIFSNVVLTCADLPVTDKEAIIGATLALGGIESKDVAKTTTHICALSLDHPKCQQAIAKGLRCKIVLPHWFDDCFKLGKRIDEKPYLLPDPEIMRARPEDDLVVPSSQHMEGATSAVPSLPLPGDESGKSARGKLTVFAKRKVLLSWDLPINTRLRNILTELIQDGGGAIVAEPDECNMFIGQYRDGPEYIRAAQSGKDVGNLAWLYHLIVHNEWTSPFRRLLHYPVPRKGIPGFENMRITLSNYGGEARIYLENLIIAAGATFTKTMKADNTHLITARKNGEKCDAALDWNIHTINHLWIEESYARCEVQSLTIPKYTHWPSRTNLGEVIGQTFLDEQRLHALYYPGGDEELDGASKRRRQLLDAAHENALVVGAPVTKPGRTPRAVNVAVNVMRESSPATNASRAAQKSRAYETPARGRHVRSGKENDTPSILSSGSRSAKAQALSKLQDLAPDIALYEKEKKRSAKDGHAPWGGKRAADQIDKERAAKSSSPAHHQPETDGEEETRRPAKKQKQSAPSVHLRLTLTGYTRWVGDKKKEDADKRKLRELGIQIVNENSVCDYLVAPKMVRTLKFLRGLSRGVDVLEARFVDDMLETGAVPDPAGYHLRDKEAERRFGVTLAGAIGRAKALRAAGRGLLRNVPVYCTADIKNGVDSYKALAEANGAIFKVYRARSGTTIRPTTREEDGGAPPEPVYLLTSNSPAEKELWPRFEAMARKGNMEPRVVVSDWMLDVILRQEYFFDKRYLARGYFPDA